MTRILSKLSKQLLNFQYNFQDIFRDNFTFLTNTIRQRIQKLSVDLQSPVRDCRIGVTFVSIHESVGTINHVYLGASWRLLVRINVTLQ